MSYIETEIDERGPHGIFSVVGNDLYAMYAKGYVDGYYDDEYKPVTAVRSRTCKNVATDGFRCSECGEHYDVGRYSVRWCPNCGREVVG